MGSLSSRGSPSGIDHAADDGLAGRHRDDAPGALDDVAFLDLVAFGQQDGADVVLLQVQGDAVDLAGEFQQFVVHDVVQAVDAGDAVPDRYHHPGLFFLEIKGEALDLLPDQLADLVDFD